MAVTAARRTWLGVVAAVLAAAILWWSQGDEPAPTPADEETSSASAQPTDIATTPAGGTDPESGLPLVAVSDLPPEAADTLALIDEGGPFPHDRDGATFENRERLLPLHETGYYREYTVETPGSDDRGARRIVVGSGGEYYYTADHYGSFERIVR